MAIAAALMLAGCGSEDIATKFSITGEAEIGTDGVQSIYIADANNTRIDYIPEGYELTINEDGSATITKLTDQATISVTGDNNIIISCQEGSCPLELVQDSNNDESTYEDNKHDFNNTQEDNDNENNTTTYTADGNASIY